MGLPGSRRGGFGPVVLTGVVAAGACALLASQSWVATPGTSLQRYPGDPLTATGEASLVGALALVALASWGVLLVTRGRVRRVMAAWVLLVSAGVVAAVVRSMVTLPGDVETALRVAGVTDPAASLQWAYALPALGAAGLLLAAAGFALRWVPRWPEMGSRYDAPRASRFSSSTTGTDTGTDVWRQLDEGRDPTT